jgi:hypothetical protein
MFGRTMIVGQLGCSYLKGRNGDFANADLTAVG